MKKDKLAKLLYKYHILPKAKTETTKTMKKILLVDMHSLKPGDRIPHPTNDVVVTSLGRDFKPGQRIKITRKP